MSGDPLPDEIPEEYVEKAVSWCHHEMYCQCCEEITYHLAYPGYSTGDTCVECDGCDDRPITAVDGEPVFGP